MLLLENERYVIECNLMLTSIPVNAPHIPFSECIPSLILYIKDKKAFYSMRNERASIHIQDYKLTDDFLSLLLVYSDKDASDPSFSKFETGDTRTVKKEDGEGLAVSAHLVIGLIPPNDKKPYLYNVLLEEVPGINKGNVNSAMTKFLSECTDFEFISDKKKNLQCRPKFSLEVKAGHALTEMLSSGWVTGFSAVKHIDKNNKLDEDGELVIEEEKIVIKAKKTKGKRAIEMIAKVNKLVGKKDYSSLYVKFVDDNKRQKTLNFNTRDENIGTKIFSKVEKIILADNMIQCEKCIHEELNGKMKTYITKMDE